VSQTETHHHIVRRLYRPDLPLFREHLLRLDSETRRDRFGLQVSDEYLENYAELCFAPGALTYGYFEDGLIRGAGELRMFPSKDHPGHRDGEAAFSVELPWRRTGIGTQLMSYIVLAARNRSIETLTIVCLRHNQAMLRLAKKFEAELAFEMSDVTGHLVARAPTAMSLWHEFVDNTLDLGASLIDFQTRLMHKSEHTGPHEA
jgi:GNAT superfamily N-acetyltransferase